jgi:TonB family protein
MFVRTQVRFGKLKLATAASVALHMIAFLFLTWLPEAAYLLPSIAPPPKNTQVVSLLPSITLPHVATHIGATHNKAGLAARPKRPVISKALPKPAESDPAGDLGPILKASNLWRIPSIHEIKLALPQVAPLPRIARSELPVGFEGDIVVEITIAKDGKVARTKVLQSVGHGLENRVVEALLTWRFTPASFDGVPVASLQDISFHYPENALP